MLSSALMYLHFYFLYFSIFYFFFFSSRRRHTRYIGDWSSDVCSSDLGSFADPGTRDTHTAVISWGDGTSSTVNIAAGVLTFSATHTYRDNPANQPNGSFAIAVTLTDKIGRASCRGRQERP